MRVQRTAEILAEDIGLLTVDTSVTPLRMLEALDVIADAVADARIFAVESARLDGYSWQLIGDALGLTRQAVQQRYATLPSACNSTPVR